MTDNHAWEPDDMDKVSLPSKNWNIYAKPPEQDMINTLMESLTEALSNFGPCPAKPNKAAVLIYALERSLDMINIELNTTPTGVTNPETQ